MTMNRIVISTIAACFALLPLGAAAQRPHAEGPRKEHRPEITEIVSDLAPAQKRKLENLTNDSKQRIEKLRGQQKAVRDSINRYMDMDGDQSRTLYPLFDREAKLQAEISRQMYATKVRIDEVLTPEQRKELKTANQRYHKKKKK